MLTHLYAFINVMMLLYDAYQFTCSVRLLKLLQQLLHSLLACRIGALARDYGSLFWLYRFYMQVAARGLYVSKALGLVQFESLGVVVDLLY